jgi:hypothetical protein
MKPTLIAVAIAAMATGAHAQAGQTTATMTCAQAKGIVTSQGAVVLRTGATTYDRQVRDSSFCAIQETAWPAWVQTADIAQCPVRTCRPSDVGNGR